VITQDEIHRSGAANVPDVLRMAPGVNVSRIDASTRAISIRGFNSRYSDKILVLIDGRSVYQPSFSGVYWDQIDVPLEDIERIEVIRGSIWRKSGRRRNVARFRPLRQYGLFRQPRWWSGSRWLARVP
jgi:outer membrane receptor for ferrienterochelin and colicin